MNEKHTPTEHTDKELRKSRFKAAVTSASSTLLLSVLTFETGHAVNIANRIDNPSAEKVLDIWNDENHIKFRFITQLDTCPKPSDPADISVMHDAIINYQESPKQIADRYNIELADPSDLYAAMPRIVDASTPEQVTGIINEFTQSHMNLSLHADDLYQNSDIDLHKYKNQIWEFMMIMQEIPITLLDRLEITDIHINAENYEHLGRYDRKTKQIDLNVDILDSPWVVLHEIIGHGTHHTSCEGFPYNDHAFSSHNPENFKYTDEKWREATPDPTAHSSQYATKNATEDYAETISNYLTGKIDVNLIGIQSPLDKKVSITLDRLNKLTPGSAEYLSSIVNHFKTYERFHQERLKRESAANK